MRNTLCWLAALVLAAAPASPLLAAAPVPEVANSGLVHVPAQAPIVVQLHGYERTKDRLFALLNKAAPDFASAASAQFDAMIQQALEGRKLQGLVKDAPLFGALMEFPAANANEPAFVAVARVTRYADFRDGILTADERKTLKHDEAGYDHAQVHGKDIFILDRKDYALWTMSKDVADLLTKKPESLADKLDADTARGLLGSDYAIYVNMSAVNKQFGDDIKAFRQAFESVFEAMPAAGAEKAQMEMAKSVFGGMFQAVDDGRSVVVGLDFRPEGLALHVQAKVGAETKTNNFLKDNRPAALADLGALPGGQTMYVGAHYTQALLRALAPVMYGLAGEGDAKKQFEAALQQLLTAGNSTSYTANNFPPMGIQVMEYQDPMKAVAGQLQLYQAMIQGGTFQNAYLKGKPEIKENAESYQGFKLNYTKLAWDLDKFAEQVPGGGEAFKGAIKRLMGDGLSMWFGTDGKRVIVVTAPSWDAAKVQIDAYLGGTTKLSLEPAYSTTRTQLPADVSMLFLADAGKLTFVMTNYMLAVFKAMPVLPIPLPDEIKPVKTATSYLGASVTLKPEYGGFDLFVPASAVVEIRKVLAPLFQGNAQ